MITERQGFVLLCLILMIQVSTSIRCWSGNRNLSSVSYRATYDCELVNGPEYTMCSYYNSGGYEFFSCETSDCDTTSKYCCNSDNCNAGPGGVKYPNDLYCNLCRDASYSSLIKSDGEMATEITSQDCYSYYDGSTMSCALFPSGNCPLQYLCCNDTNYCNPKIPTPEVPSPTNVFYSNLSCFYGSNNDNGLTSSYCFRGGVCAFKNNLSYCLDPRDCPITNSSTDYCCSTDFCNGGIGGAVDSNLLLCHTCNNATYSGNGYSGYPKKLNHKCFYYEGDKAFCGTDTIGTICDGTFLKRNRGYCCDSNFCNYGNVDLIPPEPSNNGTTIILNSPALNPGLLAGIIVGAIVFFIIVIVIIIVISRINQRKKVMDARYGAISTLPVDIRHYFDPTNKKGWKKQGETNYNQVEKDSDEWYRLIDLFNSLGSGNLKIVDAYQIYSPNLSTNFCNQRIIMAQRMEKDPNLFKKKDWMKLSNLELRTWTAENYQTIVSQYEWNANDTLTPVIPVCHATDESIAWRICENGFSTLSTLDAGFYGAGMYFSTSATYILPYFATKANPAILICLATPGNPLPVVENHKGQHSIMGKPLKSGYQSHYVNTRKDGLPFESVPTTNHFYDEIVLGQESQVVPVYLVTISKDNLFELVKEFEREMPVINSAEINEKVASAESDIEMVEMNRDREYVAFN